MKKWIHTSTDSPALAPGDKVTVYNSKVGYANYDGVFLGYETNAYGVKMALVKTDHGNERVHPSSIIPSEKEYFYSLTRNDVLTVDFIEQLIHKDDSIFCHKIKYDRVDRDPGMENVTGVEADIMNSRTGQQSYRVIITTYITKNYSESREYEDEQGVGPDDPLIQDALDILSNAPEFYVNFAGYQRTFKK